MKKTISILLGLCLLLTLLGVLPQKAEASGAQSSHPSREYFDKLWVGDVVFWYGLSHAGSITILSGDCVEIIDYHRGLGEYAKALKFTKPGNATVHVDDGTTEETYSFTVTERPSDKSVTFRNNYPTTLKVGDSLRVLHGKGYFENLNYGVPYANGYADITMSYTAKTYITGYAGGYFPYEVLNDRTYEPDRIRFTASEYDELVLSPGTITLQPVHASKNLGAPITITIDAPVITNNIPASIKVGSTLNLTTALTNTSLVNQKISSDLHGLVFQPSVTVTAGKDLVLQSNQDYSNTLCSSETLTFKKTGTVKLKIAYTQVLPEFQSQLLEPYIYETTVTIQVTDGSTPTQPTSPAPTGTEASKPPETATPVTDPAEASSEPESETSAIEEQPTDIPSVPQEQENVTVTDAETGVEVSAEAGVLPENTVLVVKPSDYVLQDADGKFAAFDITLEKDFVKIQPNGKVRVSIPIPIGYDKEHLTIYRITDDGVRTALPSTVEGDRIVFETDHFSLYVIAETATGGQSGGKNTVMWISLSVLLLALLLGGVALWHFKFRNVSSKNAASE